MPEIDLWLDPRRSQRVAWLSHAHSDHARGGHGVAIGTPDTLEIYALRAGDATVADTRMCPLHYGEQLEHQGARITALPAGHILGAAQLLVEYGNQRLVYTGDIKLRPPLCGATTAIVPCDHLIMECTFGLPVFHFLTRDEATRRIVAFARECLSDGDTPVFLGYALGRGQEIAHVLAAHGIPTMVHGAIARYFSWYERAGYGFGDWIPYQRSQLAMLSAGDDGGGVATRAASRQPPHSLSADAVPPRALIAVPSFRNTLQAGSARMRVAYVSGWASMDNARARTGAEALIPYSDHGDFPELLGIVQQATPSRVDAVHGFTDVFASILRNRGIDAQAPAEFGEPAVSGEQELDEEASA